MPKTEEDCIIVDFGSISVNETRKKFLYLYNINPEPITLYSIKNDISNVKLTLEYLKD